MRAKSCAAELLQALRAKGATARKNIQMLRKLINTSLVETYFIFIAYLSDIKQINFTNIAKEAITVRNFVAPAASLPQVFRARHSCLHGRRTRTLAPLPV